MKLKTVYVVAEYSYGLGWRDRHECKTEAAAEKWLEKYLQDNTPHKTYGFCYRYTIRKDFLVIN